MGLRAGAILILRTLATSDGPGGPLSTAPLDLPAVTLSSPSSLNLTPYEVWSRKGSIIGLGPNDNLHMIARTDPQMADACPEKQQSLASGRLLTIRMHFDTRG